MQNGTGYAVGNPSTATLNITDNDFAFKADNTGGSSGGNPFMAEDPCSCNGDQVLNADGSVATVGTFEETVTITGTAGLQVRVAAATGMLNTTLPAMMTETSAGTYEITFNHTDRVGYSISRFEFSNNGGVGFSTVTDGTNPVTISNVCAYPRVVCNVVIPSSITPNDPPITLSLNETSTDVSFTPLTGFPRFTVNGNPATIFDPSDPTLNLGNYTIVGTFDIMAGTGQGGTTSNPAIPIDKDNDANTGVCPVRLTKTPFTLNPAPIPTMSEWGLIIFGLLVLNMGVFFIRKKEWGKV